MAKYATRPIDVKKGTPTPITNAPESDGFVVLFDADTAALKEREDIRKALLPSSQRRNKNLRLLLRLADVHASKAVKVEIKPEWTGTLWVLDVAGDILPGPVKLQAVQAAHKLFRRGDNEHPGPIIIRNWPPPRPRRDEDTFASRIIDRVTIELRDRLGNWAGMAGVLR